jgi:hypothetical protein
MKSLNYHFTFYDKIGFFVIILLMIVGYHLYLVNGINNRLDTNINYQPKTPIYVIVHPITDRIDIQFNPVKNKWELLAQELARNIVEKKTTSELNKFAEDNYDIYAMIFPYHF